VEPQRQEEYHAAVKRRRKKCSYDCDDKAAQADAAAKLLSMNAKIQQAMRTQNRGLIKDLMRQRTALHEGPHPNVLCRQLLPELDIQQVAEQLAKPVAAVAVAAEPAAQAKQETPKSICLPKEAVIRDWSHQQLVTSSFVVVPHQHSAADGYNQYRTPTGCVRTTTTGQAIEFFDRVYVPPSSFWDHNRIWLSPAA
jgi:hypothetical protein